MPFLPGDLYTNAPLTRAAVAGWQKATSFVAPFAFPRLIVDAPSGIYYKLLLADLNRQEMAARGPNAPAQVAGYAKEDATYKVPTESLAYELNDTVRKASAAALDPSKVIPKLLTYKALMRSEAMVGALMSSSLWYRTVTGAAANSVTEGATSDRKRFTDTSHDPINAFLQEIEFQSKLSGFEPNGLIFGRKAWTGFRTNPYVLASLVGTTGIVRTKPASKEEVAALLGLTYVGVSGAIYNSAAQNLSASNARIVPEDSCLLYYRGDSTGDDPGTWNDEMPVAAASQVWEGGAGNAEGLRIRSFRVETAGAGGSEHSEIDTFRTWGVITSVMGTLFEDCTTGI